MEGEYRRLVHQSSRAWQCSHEEGEKLRALVTKEARGELRVTTFPASQHPALTGSVSKNGKYFNDGQNKSYFKMEETFRSSLEQNQPLSHYILTLTYLHKATASFTEGSRKAIEVRNNVKSRSPTSKL